MRNEFVTFRSGKDDCAATLFWPDRPAGRPPVVVMCLGLGGERGMKLDAFAARFCSLGYVCVIFDYRGWGESGGKPRHVASVAKQQADLRACLDWLHGREDMNGKRPVLWGVSYGGGHALAVASAHPGIRAVILHTPFVDGLAAAVGKSAWNSLKLSLHGLLDLLLAPFGAAHCVTLAAKPGKTAILNTPECLEGFLGILPEGYSWANKVAARVAFSLPFYRPGRRAGRISCPVFIVAGEKDTLVPIASVRKTAARLLRGQIREFPETHFSMYFGDAFEQAVAAQADFLARVPA